MTHTPVWRAAALLLLLLSAGCATPPARDQTDASPPAAQRVIVLSFDGLPAAAATDGSMPALRALGDAGVRAAWLSPSYPSLTFPNHYTLATGLRPDHHGIVHNYLRDPGYGRFWSKRNGSEARWYGGDPIWNTLQRQGGRAATVMWIGAQDPADPRRPALWTAFDAAQPADARIDQMLAWLDLPPARRPRLLMAYFDRHDVDAHAHGPASPEAMAARRALDGALQRLLDGLDARGLRAGSDVVVVSDHGMAQVPPRNVELLTRAVPRSAYEVEGSNIVLGIHPRPGQDAAVEAALVGRHGHHACYRKAELPARWHYGTHPRVAPIVCQADAGWYLYADAPARRATAMRGEHGYDPDDPSMRAVFVAAGPSFRAGTRLPAFDNVDLYPLLARLLGIRPSPNDGDIAPLLPALRDAPPAR